jgi:hypothetical protein
MIIKPRFRLISGDESLSSMVKVRGQLLDVSKICHIWMDFIALSEISLHHVYIYTRTIRYYTMILSPSRMHLIALDNDKCFPNQEL